MNYIEKNKQNIVIAAIGLIVVIMLVAFWFQRQMITSNEIIAEVTPSYLKVGEAIKFEDKTPFAKSIKWDFGDGTTSDKVNGTHTYNKADYYTVILTVNNKEKKTWKVLVSENNVEPRILSAQPSDSTASTIIAAPATARQLERVPFKAVSSTAKTFSWQFGETGRVDSKEKTVYYYYTKPGNYVVTLRTDDSDNAIHHNIEIVKAYGDGGDDIIAAPTGAAAAAPDDSAQKAADDFKIRLQRIANGDFKNNYSYLVNKYLCNKENTPIVENGEKERRFYYYATGLQFNTTNVVIQEVKLTFDSSQNCVVKVEVTQSK